MSINKEEEINILTSAKIKIKDMLNLPPFILSKAPIKISKGFRNCLKNSSHSDFEKLFGPGHLTKIPYELSLEIYCRSIHRDKMKVKRDMTPELRKKIREEKYQVYYFTQKNTGIVCTFATQLKSEDRDSFCIQISDHYILGYFLEYIIKKLNQLNEDKT
jgi:hypothetical protein